MATAPDPEPIQNVAPNPPSTPGLPVPAAAGPALNASPVSPGVLLQPTQSKLVPASPLPTS